MPEPDCPVARAVEHADGQQVRELLVEHGVGESGDLLQQPAVDVTTDRRRDLRQLDIDARGRKAREQRVA